MPPKEGLTKSPPPTKAVIVVDKKVGSVHTSFEHYWEPYEMKINFPVPEVEPSDKEKRDAELGLLGEDARALARLRTVPLWEGATVMVDEMLRQGRSFTGIQPRTILELGAGLGVPGMVAALIWPEATVVLTDSETQVVSILKKNAETNFSDGRVTACKLPFGMANPGKALGIQWEAVDVILISECFYKPWYGDTWTSLSETLSELCGEHTLVLMAVQYWPNGGVGEALAKVIQPPFVGRHWTQGEVSVWLLARSEETLDKWVTWEELNCGF
eukprot:gnl/MRDRNA2_/MRDRNA2_33857_c0_seq1.p1 gnl/MRDRNA2_/MRDRNA2_33857_c0~~gnl/MRDRNA2_/MRDRNA2_33857_c0_seq1.p1  ORF type:complete len:272 (+),score=42.11 gnl/MRDRNA2_/MRDRNA2_33857_c0_seq1:82-897(+)